MAQEELGVIKKIHLQKERYKRIDVTTDYLLHLVGMKTMSCPCPRAQCFSPVFWGNSAPQYPGTAWLISSKTTLLCSLLARKGPLGESFCLWAICGDHCQTEKVLLGCHWCASVDVPGTFRAGVCSWLCWQHVLLPPALAHLTAQKKVWSLQSIPVVSSKEQGG